jgi:hypothetical protein
VRGAKEEEEGTVGFGVRTPSLPAGGLLIWVGRQGWLQRPKPPSLSSPLLPPCCAPAAANRVGSVCATLTYLPGPAAAAEISTHSRNSPPPSVHTDRPVEPAPVGGPTASRRAGACGQTEPEEWVPPPTSGGRRIPAIRRVAAAAAADLSSGGRQVGECWKRRRGMFSFSPHAKSVMTAPRRPLPLVRHPLALRSHSSNAALEKFRHRPDPRARLVPQRLVSF